MDTPATPPALDVGRVARLRDVLAGGHLALEADRLLAEEVRARWPYAPALVRAANEFHRRAARWAVTGGTPEFPVPEAGAVVFAAAGYPAGGGFHAAAAMSRPGARFVYCDADEAATAYNRALLAAADPWRVRVAQVSARRPAELLADPAVEAVLRDGPVQLQLQLAVHWWPAGFASWAIGEYARGLPGGSTVAVSAWVDGDAGAAGAAPAGDGLVLHAGGDLAAWIEAAGMELVPPGVTDVRGREQEWAAAMFGRRPGVRMVEGVALVP